MVNNEILIGQNFIGVVELIGRRIDFKKFFFINKYVSMTLHNCLELLVKLFEYLDWEAQISMLYALDIFSQRIKIEHILPIVGSTLKSRFTKLYRIEDEEADFFTFGTHSRLCTDWDWILTIGCFIGDTYLVDLSMKHGANNWDRAVTDAAAGGHTSLIERMINQGATRLDTAFEFACRFDHIDAAVYLDKTHTDMWNDERSKYLQGMPPVLLDDYEIKRINANNPFESRMDSRKKNFWSAGLLRSAEIGQIILVNLILDQCNDIGDLTSLNLNGALQQAYCMRKKYMVDLELIRYSTEKERLRLIQIIANHDNNYFAIVDKLIAAGANIYCDVILRGEYLPHFTTS